MFIKKKIKTEQYLIDTRLGVNYFESNLLQLQLLWNCSITITITITFDFCYYNYNYNYFWKSNKLYYLLLFSEPKFLKTDWYFSQLQNLLLEGYALAVAANLLK